MDLYQTFLKKHKDIIYVAFRIMIIELIVELSIMWLILPPLGNTFSHEILNILDPILLVMITTPIITFFITKPFIDIKNNLIKELIIERERLNTAYAEKESFLKKHSSNLEKEVTIAKRKFIISAQRYSLAAKGANDGLWDWNLTNNKIYLSPRWKEILGYHTAELKSDIHTWINLIHPEDRDAFQKAVELSTTSQSKNHHEFEYRMQKKDGDYIWVLSRWLTVFTEDRKNQAIRLVGSQSNINKRKQLELRLTYDASHDFLTGLRNRNYLVDNLNVILRNNDQKHYLLLVDLDKFKMINDSLGHGIGDELLKQVAIRIKSACQRPDIVARIGGDEFAIITTYDQKINPIELAKKIIASFNQDFQISNIRFSISLSIGITNIHTRYQEVSEVLRDADIALYQAKNDHGNCFKEFEVTMRYEHDKLFTISQDLLKAIENQQLHVVFQPIYDIQQNQIIGAEALLRWKHPVYGFIDPNYFINIAEKSQYIAEIFHYVLTSSCHAVKAIEHLDNTFYITMNLSGHQFSYTDILQEFKSVLTTYNLSPHQLKVEITESTLINFKSYIGTHLQYLREFGIKIGLDDFGTGYSSINLLSQFPFDYVKIDRGCINDIVYNANSHRLLSGIVQILNSMSSGIIIEGVENKQQVNLLKELAIQYIQGYYFSKPLPQDELIEFYSNALKEKQLIF